MLHETFTDELQLKYSQMERVCSVDDVQHPIVREALKLVPLPGINYEICSMADIKPVTRS